MDGEVPDFSRSRSSHKLELAGASERVAGQMTSWHSLWHFNACIYYIKYSFTDNHDTDMHLFFMSSFHYT
jgi:hypothetical protein